MTEIQMGICIGDVCYAERFSAYLMKHRRGQFHIHCFSSCEILLGDIPDHFQVLILSDYPDKRTELAEAMKKRGTSVFYLLENAAEQEAEDNIHFTEKYQDINIIMDEILTEIRERIGEDRTAPFAGRESLGVKKLITVYSLTNTALQLPFTLTAADVISEQKKVLIVDLQENSGMRSLYPAPEGHNLEDLLVMTAGGRFSYNRIRNCIGGDGQKDFIYPAEHTSCLYEAAPEDYPALLQTLLQNTDYQVILVNIGSHIPGFHELLKESQVLCMVSGDGFSGQWRYPEFYREMQERGLILTDDANNLADAGDAAYSENAIYSGNLPEDSLRICRFRLPAYRKSQTDIRTLADLWIQGQTGDMIRRKLQEEEADG